MIELSEARTIARDLRKEILGKTIVDVGGNYVDHKFTFYYGDPNQYKNMLINKKVTNIIDRNYYVEIEIEDKKLVMRDGANIRFYDNRQDYPEKSKLLIEFNDGSFLNVTTSMYSFIALFDKEKGMKDDVYYMLELNGIGPLDSKFTLDYFQSLLNEDTLKLSVKAFLATKQRIVGLGNGTVGDIMFNAGLHPKRKMNTLSKEEIQKLYNCIINTTKEMIEKGGRDTEKNIYGESGEYKTKLSSKTYKNGCPNCGGEITKEQYLGGSIYYCPICQNNIAKPVK